MGIIRDELINKRKELVEALERAEYSLKNAPSIDVKLRITNSKRSTQFYIRKHSEKEGQYLKSQDKELARLIAQRDYDWQVKEYASKGIARIDRLLNGFEEDKLKTIYADMHVARRRLINPVEISDDEYAERWLKNRNTASNTYEMNGEIVTEQGELVRSKSEKILADKLYMCGVPYKYEEMLLVGRNKLFPDFTVLNKKTRKQYYWEHFGMMDNEEYSIAAVQKLETYNRNNIVIGKNLICTFETIQNPFNSKTAERIIQEFLM